MRTDNAARIVCGKVDGQWRARRDADVVVHGRATRAAERQEHDDADHRDVGESQSLDAMPGREHENPIVPPSSPPYDEMPANGFRNRHSASGRLIQVGW